MVFNEKNYANIMYGYYKCLLIAVVWRDWSIIVNNHKADITKTWTILNNQGVHHELIFNKIPDHPLIISGWPCLEAYYSLPTDVVVEVGYYWNNKFGISGFKEALKL